MEQEELIKFIQWLPENIEAFNGMSPDEVAKELNNISEQQDGESKIEYLISQFKQSIIKYGLGDKILKLVNRFKSNNNNSERSWEKNDRVYIERKNPDNTIIQEIYRTKNFNGDDLISPEIIRTVRTIDNVNGDTTIFSQIDKNFNYLFDNKVNNPNNKANGEKFNKIFDKEFGFLNKGFKIK